MHPQARLKAGKLKAGKLKALAVAGERRQPALPDVPTFAALGHRGLVITAWQGILVPPGTDRLFIVASSRLRAGNAGAMAARRRLQA